MPSLPPMAGQRVAAIVAGLGSYATTLLFLWAVGVPGWWGVVFAALVEFVLTMCKQIGGPAAWGAHGIDTFLNGGGLFPYVLQLDKTPTWQMLVAGLGLEGDVRSLPALILALAFGLVLSLAPLALWRGRRRRKD
jgi:hypothetical protein